MNTIELSDFLSNEYVDFSSYDLVRKIASYVDGQKNASRKILHTVRENNINSFVKVANLGPKVQDFTQYLHGSLEGTIVNVTADYVGSGNNIPMLQGDGNFGSAFIPANAATRYIFARQNEVIKNIYTKDDTVLLEEQYFEGDKIEPKYYVPTLPMLAINGSEGISIGFAQKILPRDPKEIIKWVTQKASGKRITANLTPYWNGMTCTVEQGEESNKWVIKGSFTRNSTTKITIDSLPIGYDLKAYQNVLDKLVEDKVIKDYDDLSDNDIFKFEISCTREFSSKSDDKLMEVFKLIKRVSENYTCIDRNNKIVVFNDIKEILNAWYEVRLEYNQKRKDYILDKLKTEMLEMAAKRAFIMGVVNEDIELRNRTEEQIFSDAIKYSETLEPYLPKLINLPMRMLTTAEINKLQDQLKAKKAERDLWEAKTFEEITLDDVKEIRL